MRAAEHLALSKRPTIGLSYSTSNAIRYIDEDKAIEDDLIAHRGSPGSLPRRHARVRQPLTGSSSRRQTEPRLNLWKPEIAQLSKDFDHICHELDLCFQAIKSVPLQSRRSSETMNPDLQPAAAMNKIPEKPCQTWTCAISQRRGISSRILYWLISRKGK